MALQVIFDHSQKRLARDRFNVVASGVDWITDGDGDYWANTWIEPVANRLLLRPGPLFGTWYTSNTGITAKLALADFSGATAGAWVSNERLPGAGVYLVCQGANEPLITSSAWAVNTGGWFSFYTQNSGDTYKVASFGWNSTASLAGGVGFELYSDGFITVWKGGVQVASYRISGDVTTQQDNDSLVGIMVIPMSGRDILVVTNRGSGFIHTFEDIDEGTVSPVILPNAKVWVDIPSPVKPDFQVAKIQFPTTGYATTRKLSFPEDPDPTALLTPGGRFFYDFTDGASHTAPTFQLFNADCSGPYPPALVAGEEVCRIRVSLAGDGTYSPVVRGGEVFYERTVTTTDDSEEFDVTGYILEASLNVPEDPAGTTFSMTLRLPEELNEAGKVKNLLVGGNRPVKVMCEGTCILDGFSEAARWETSIYDGIQRAHVTVRDRTKSGEHYYHPDITMHDGRELSVAVFEELKLWGLEAADCDLDTTALVLGAVPSKNANDWNVLVSPGETAAGNLRSLIEDNAPSYLARFVPDGSDTPRFHFKSPATLNAEPVRYTLYPNTTTAIAEGVDENDIKASAREYVFQRLERETMEPEANDIRILGRDPRDGKMFVIRKTDDASINPTTAPSSRPDNWVGERRKAGTANPGITTKALGIEAAEKWADLLFGVQQMAEIDTGFLFYDKEFIVEESIETRTVPVWVGDKITLFEIGTYKVAAFNVKFFKEPNAVLSDTTFNRKATYVLGEGSMLRGGGSSLASIKEANRLRAASSDWLKIRPGAEDIIKRTPKAVYSI